MKQQEAQIEVARIHQDLIEKQQQYNPDHPIVKVLEHRRAEFASLANKPSQMMG